MKKLISLAVAVLAVLSASAADYTIQAKVLDKLTSGAIEMGTVRLLSAKDSSLVAGTATDLHGEFVLPKVKPGSYILEFKYLGYHTQYKNVTVKDRPLMLPNILMEEDTQHLEEVQVTGMAAQMIVKVDTMEFNASAFKTQENAVVEDLLKRLPGVEVSDGTITVNGETISRIKVDGKKFFDGDIEMTTKNLTADMVEKIQVIDEKSDMAKLTGFEDDETERIINITLKKNRKKGIFGNVSGGGGADLEQEGLARYTDAAYDWNSFLPDDARYNANTFVNIMLGESQTAVVAGANNTNTSRSGRGRSNRGWGNNSGITSTQNIGLNNNTAISDKLLVGGDASYNHSKNETKTETNQDNWLSGDTLTNNKRSGSTSYSDNTNVRMELEWKPDTLTTLIFQPTLSWSRNTSDSWSDYDYYTNGDSTSWGNSHNTSVSDNLNSRLNLIMSRKSARRSGRSFTLNLNGSYGNSNSTGNNRSEKDTHDSITLIDQQTLNTSDSYGMNVRGSYVEPLWNLKNFIELSASFNYSERNSEKLQYDKDAEGIYVADANLNREYSNDYRNLSYSEILELNYRYNNGTLNMMGGLKMQPTQNFSHTTYMDGTDPYNATQKVLNFSPTLSVRYNLGDRRNFLRMEYRGNSQQPSITQMQPVKNNSNLMNETVGNAELNPAYSQNLRFIVTRYNPETFASWNATLFGTLTQNALVSNSIYDQTGKQFNQTVNALKSPYSMNGSFMYNTPVIPNRLHLNTRTSVSYQRRIGYTGRMADDEEIDITALKLGNESLTKSYNANENLSLTFTHDVIEIGARGSFGYGHTHNYLSGNLQNTLTWSGSGNVNVHLPYSINLATDISYSDRQGYANFDQSEILWNATVDKTIKNKLTIALSLTDILRQRLNIVQNIGDNYISYNSYNTLPSYFLLTFTWKISKFGFGTSQESMQQGDGRQRGPMGGMPGGGMGGGMPGGMPPGM